MKTKNPFARLGLLLLAFFSIALVGCDDRPGKPRFTGVFISATQEAYVYGSDQYIGATNRPRVKGTSDDGTTVSVFANSKCEGNALESLSAEEFATSGLTTMVVEGSQTTFSAIAKNEDGTSDCSTDNVEYLHDPDRPIVPQPPMALFTTPSSPSFDSSPIVKGRTEPDARVEVYVNDPTCSERLFPSAGADGDGYFELPITVPVNTTSKIYLRIFDLAENSSDCGPAEGLFYEHDDQLTLSFTGPSFPSNNATPMITGMTDPGSNVVLYDSTACDGMPIGTGDADLATGLFSIQATVRTPAIGEFGVVTTTIRASTLDLAGNFRACSEASLAYTFDNEAPSAPNLLSTTPNLPSNDETPLVNGHVDEAGAWIEIFAIDDSLPGDCQGDSVVPAVQAGQDGNFSIPIIVAENTTSRISVRARDQAGNQSTCSETTLLYVEDSSVQAVTFIGLSVAAINNASMFNVLGVAEAGSTVELFASPTCDPQLKIGDDSAANFADPGILVTLPESQFNSQVQIHAKTTDAQGNSECSTNSISYTHDLVSPPAPSISSGAAANNNTPTLLGSNSSDLNPGVANIYRSNNCFGTLETTVPVSSAGTFSTTVTVADNTVTQFSARHIDAAGNLSACSPFPANYREDSIPPSTPNFGGTNPPSPSTDGTPIVTAIQTQNPSPLYSTETYKVRIIIGNDPCSSTRAYVGEETDWSGVVHQAQVEAHLPTWGTYLFRAYTVDRAGNASACSSGSANYTYQIFVEQ